MQHYCLVEEEKGYTRVEEILNSVTFGNAVVFLHKVTLTEVTYDLLRSGMYIDAAELFSTCYKLPIIIAEDLSDSFVTLAAGFKVRYRISFADSFVLALAKSQNAKILTSDHHEFDPIEKGGELSFEWIR